MNPDYVAKDLWFEQMAINIHSFLHGYVLDVLVVKEDFPANTEWLPSFISTLPASSTCRLSLCFEHVDPANECLR